MDEGSGTSISDSSGNSKTATLSNMTNDDWVAGIENIDKSNFNITTPSGHTTEAGTTSTFKVALLKSPTLSPAAPTAPSSEFYNISTPSGHTSEAGTTSTFNVSLKNAPEGGSWELIAKQANSDEHLFSANARTTFLENANDSSQSTFMSIGNLNKNNYSDSNGKYKFKQVWGGSQVDSENIKKEATWTQTSWITSPTITGFQEIGTSGYGPSGNALQGLGKSDSTHCVIDGNGGTGNWWNCAGAINRHGGGIPGPMSKIASSMYLYVWNPATSVKVNVSSSNTSEGTVSPATLTFTNANWNTPQTVTVTGKNDSDSDGNQKYNINLNVDLDVTTIAGTGSGGSANGQGTSASFYWPIGLNVDLAGNIFVADQSNNRIRRIDTQGNVITLAGTGSQGHADGSAASATFKSPRGVFSDRSGNVYVSDSDNHLIRKIEINPTSEEGSGPSAHIVTSGTCEAAGYSLSLIHI